MVGRNPGRAGDVLQLIAIGCLRGNPVSKRVGMKIGMVTHTGPGAILLGCLGHTVLFTGGKVVP